LTYDVPDTHDETWRIVDDDGAAWASRKLQAAHREVAKVDAWAEREKARIDRVAEEEKRSHERDIDFFQTHLALWLRDLIADGRTKKSLSLPGGKIQLRARQPKLNIENEQHLLDYLRGHHPDLVKVRESVNLSALKKAVALDGQTVVLGWRTCGPNRKRTVSRSPLPRRKHERVHHHRSTG